MKGTKSLQVFTILLFSFSASAQVDNWWEENKPETVYLTEMAVADSFKFTNEFEYPFALVLNEQERDEYSSIPNITDRKYFIRDYIKEHNENPLLPVNYWLLEFIGRYEQARKEFAIDEPPYFDVRGEYYIKYGKPDRRFEDQGGYKRSWLLEHVEELFETDRSSAELMDTAFKISRNESWYYTNDKTDYIFHFMKNGNTWEQIDRLDKVIVDRRASTVVTYWMTLVKDREHFCPQYSWLTDDIIDMENFTTEFAIMQKEFNAVGGGSLYVPNGILEKVLSTKPEGNVKEMMWAMDDFEIAMAMNARPNLDLRFDNLSIIPLSYDIAQFKREDGRTRLDLTMLASVDKVLDLRKQIDTPDSVSVDFQFMIRNEGYQTLYNIPIHTQFNYNELVEADLVNATGSVSLPLSPMQGDVTMQVKDPVNQNVGFNKTGLTVRDFSGDSLMVSDIKLFMEPMNDMQKKLLPIARAGGYDITPYPFKDVYNTIPLTCYFEVYNVIDSGIRGEYTIDINVARIELSLFEKFKKFLKSPDSYTTGIRRERAASENDSSELIGLDISTLNPGRYILEVVITDKKDNKNTAAAEKIIDIRMF